MKKTLPFIVSVVVGLLAIAVFYIPGELAGNVEGTLTSWGQVLAATALILGGINIVQVNYPKIRRRERDWQYKVILLTSAAIMLLAGLPWHRLAGEPERGTVGIAAALDADLAAGNRARLVIDADDGDMVSVDGAPPVSARSEGAQRVIEVAPGTHALRVFRGSTGYAISGYDSFEGEVALVAGNVATVRAHPNMKWGLEGRVFSWLYDHVFAPCNATMFSLLAFFIASAAFRAFRARNVEAALLLGAAILVMLGRVPIGRLLWSGFPDISDWLVDVPNNAGRRAIMMGAALGAVVTGLRIILGLERSHLGSD